MQLLINIDEEVYNRTLPYKDSPIESNLANDYPELIHAVANGMPLPKCHGRLVDEKDLSLMTVHMINGILVCDAPTIIEASINNKREKEPKSCDRNICMLNEYRGIECDKCEVMTERDDYIYTGY